MFDVGYLLERFSVDVFYLSVKTFIYVLSIVDSRCLLQRSVFQYYCADAVTL